MKVLLVFDPKNLLKAKRSSAVRRFISFTHKDLPKREQFAHVNIFREDWRDRYADLKLKRHKRSCVVEAGRHSTALIQSRNPLNCSSFKSEHTNITHILLELKWLTLHWSPSLTCGINPLRNHQNKTLLINYNLSSSCFRQNNPPDWCLYSRGYRTNRLLPPQIADHMANILSASPKAWWELKCPNSEFPQSKKKTKSHFWFFLNKFN